MKKIFASLLLTAALGMTVLGTQLTKPPAVTRLDRALDELVSADAQVEVLKSDYFAFLEGPVWVQEAQRGYLLFSDMPANCIYKLTPDGQVSVFLERSGFTGTDTSTAGVEMNNGRFVVIVHGSNAITLDAERRVVFAQHGDRAVVRLEKDGTRTILADRYDGKRLNSPNDLVIKSDGALYFTDPPNGLRGGNKSPLKELPFAGVYLLKDGKVQLLDKDPQGSTPNGIALSPDEKVLYVNGGNAITRYDVQPDDTVANGRLFVEMRGSSALKVDRKGNVYATASISPGVIWILSPSGKHLGTIAVPETPSNLAFGDADSKGLYITGRRGVYRIRVKTPGVRP